MYKRTSSLPTFSIKGNTGKRNSSEPEIRYSKTDQDNVEIRFIEAHFDDLNSHRNHKHGHDHGTELMKEQGRGIKLTAKPKDKALGNKWEYQYNIKSDKNVGVLDFIDEKEDYVMQNTQDGHFKDFDTILDTDLKDKGMAKGHYVDKTHKKSCHGCQKPFKLKRAAKHCRRCGEVFCIKCVKYRRKLNIMANPDPEGKTRKVCKACFEGDLLILGCTRSLADEFANERSFAKYTRVMNNRVNSLTTTFWPDQLDRRSECLRLVRGFQQEVKQLGPANALQGLKVKLKTPAWQKSKYWDIEIQASKCRSCKGDVGLRKSSGNCRVCGLALCRKCSFKQLLLFFEDGGTAGEGRLAIIHTSGAPSREPDISMLLYVCLDCKTYISQQQICDLHWFTRGVIRSVTDDILVVDVKFEDLKRKIAGSVQRLEEYLEKAAANIELTSSGKRNASAEKTSLRVTLDTYDKELKHMRSWLGQSLSRTQTTVLQNFIKSKYDFYMEHMYKCRMLGNKLDGGRLGNVA